MGFTSANALAQTPPTPTVPAASGTPAPVGASEAQPGSDATTALPPPGPSISPSTGAAAAAPAPAGAVGAAPTPDTAKERKWYDVVNFGAFVDAYYSQNWNNVRPNTAANRYHAFTPNTGFNLSWVGLDASVEPDPVGAVVQLRFGPSVPNLALGDFAIPGGIGFVQNGYVSWKPQGKDGAIKLIVGKFDTIYGAEVAQSHLNINYTRGYLYNLAQPFFHTGLRADIQLSDLLAFKLLAVNGWNNTIDNAHGKTFGTQLALTPTKDMTFLVGYLGGPEEADVTTVTCTGSDVFDGATNTCIPPAPGTTGGATSGSFLNTGAASRWRHLVDVVADVNVTSKLRLVANADIVSQVTVDPLTGKDTAVHWYGAAAYARYALTDAWGIAARGEMVRDKSDGVLILPSTPNPVAARTLYTGTLTVDVAPHKMLLIRLDNRVDAVDADDAADAKVFGKNLGDAANSQFTTTLGVVAKTN